ncbi:MAG: hypothetical protein ACJ76P_03220 [Actinomycetota bacterium]
MNGEDGRNSSDGANISENKIRANRENAQRSTGPRTATGKARSRQNARRHGIFVTVAVIRGGEGAEDKREFEDLLERLTDDLAPVGALQETLVEKLALLMWRERRLYRFELGAIKDEADRPFARWEEEQLWRAPGADVRRPALRERIRVLSSVLSEISAKDPLSRPSDALAGALEEIAFAHGFVKPTGQGRQDGVPAGDATQLFFDVISLGTSMSGEDAWAWIDQQLRHDIASDEALIRSLDEKEEAMGMLAAMPRDDREAKILRYEAHLSRVFARTLEQFWRAKEGPRM